MMYEILECVAMLVLAGCTLALCGIGWVMSRKLDELEERLEEME